MRIFIRATALAALVFSLGVAQAARAAPSPKIEFSATVYDFGKVTPAELVKHDFAFTNIGQANLEISDVRPGCGCTTAGPWTRNVPPGKTGIIPLQFNPANFSGGVVKSAVILCNDPEQTNVRLQLSGTVWKPIEVTPTSVIFSFPSEFQSNQTKIIRILSNLDQPLTLSNLQCPNQCFRLELETEIPGKQFVLHATAIPPFASTPVVAPITLKTSSSRIPVLTLSASVFLQPAITVSPQQIVLPPGPLARAINSALTIRNDGTNALKLWEVRQTLPQPVAVARVTHLRPQVRILEPKAGRLFEVTATFPQGFELKEGEKLELTFESNHPQFTLIKVPVFQPKPPLRIPSSPPKSFTISNGAPTLRIVPSRSTPTVVSGN